MRFLRDIDGSESDLSRSRRCLKFCIVDILSRLPYRAWPPKWTLWYSVMLRIHFSLECHSSSHLLTLYYDFLSYSLCSSFWFSIVILNSSYFLKFLFSEPLSYGLRAVRGPPRFALKLYVLVSMILVIFYNSIRFSSSISSKRSEVSELTFHELTFLSSCACPSLL